MNRKGFTLIELLIVVVIIGILAAIAIPKFANTKAKAYIDSMKSDLRNLGTVGLAAGNGGWAVTITNNNLTTPLVTCAIFINTAVLAPAVTEGAPACQ